jgi:putative transposase
MDWEGEELSITVQAELLSLNRSSLYYEARGPNEFELIVKRRIDEIYTESPFYGSPKITKQMRQEGYLVNHKRIENYMQQMGLAGIRPGPNLSKRRLSDGIWPYLLRGLAITQPRQVYGIDITYIRMLYGWMYLVAVLDWYSRYVVSWELSETLELSFVLKAVERALLTGTPEIMNSDQGSHFTSAQYISLLLAAGVKISMDGRGRALDNVFTERLWRSVKYEEVYLHEYDSPRMAYECLSRYLTFYNNRRIHQALAYRTPAQVYLGVH